MAVVKLDELLTKVNGLIPEGSEDLTILEDISDTFNDLSTKANTDWKAKYNEAREAYRTRFVEGEADEPETDPEGPEPQKLTFESLFEEEEV